MDGAQVRLLVLNIIGSNTTCYNGKFVMISSQKTYLW